MIVCKAVTTVLVKDPPASVIYPEKASLARSLLSLRREFCAKRTWEGSVLTFKTWLSMPMRSIVGEDKSSRLPGGSCMLLPWLPSLVWWSPSILLRFRYNPGSTWDEELMILVGIQKSQPRLVFPCSCDRFEVVTVILRRDSGTASSSQFQTQACVPQATWDLAHFSATAIFAHVVFSSLSNFLMSLIQVLHNIV